MIKIELNTHNKENNRWHSNIKIKNKGYSIYLSNTPSGCGQMILHNWAYSTNKILLKESLLYILNIIQNKKGIIDDLKYASPLDVGSIITTVGENYYNSEQVEILEEVGFKCISEYINPRHSSTYKQRLYIWTIN